MNRRKLKKAIHNSMSLLQAECLYYELVKEADKEQVALLTDYIAEKHDDFIARVSVKEGNDVPGRVKMFYDKLWQELNADIRNMDNKIAELTK